MPGLEISVKSNLREVASWLTDLQKQQLPFATSMALNDTVFDSMNDVRAEVRHVFNAPTPWVLRQIGYKKSNKRDLVALVGFIDPRYNNRGEYLGVELSRTTRGAHIISPHLEGGPRGPMGVELQMRRAGFLAGDEFLVPGKDMPLNQYGNVSMAMYNKMLSGLGAQSDRFANSKYYVDGVERKSRSGNWKRWWIGRVNGRKVIFYRKSRHVLMIAFIIVKRPTYKKRFDLKRTVDATVSRRFNRHFARRMQMALSTAK